jgi:adenylate cyclase
MRPQAKAINSVPMPICDTSAIAAWLTDGARPATQPQQILAELCERLLACGVPLWRVAVFVRTLHPQVMGRRIIWRPGTALEISEAPFELLDSAAFLDNPIPRVYATGEAIRRKLEGPASALDFPVLDELRAEGVTDYFATPLFFTDGTIHVATWTTRQPGGFSNAEIAGLERVIAPLARVTEIYALRRTATNLLDTYVGRSPGERILAGHIRRGDIEEIHAAIWLSDMRGFTALADRMPPRELIDLLNRYFDCQVPAILDHRAEVLKFMGDGLLAIFPIADDNRDADEVCCRTLAAARQVRANVAELSEAIGVENLAALRFGLALHVGEVLYGNIGGGNRLDFTCIGPAVNLAARIEKLTSQLRRTVLASGEFAGHCPHEFTVVDQFALRGFSATQLVFGLEDETPHC